MTCDLLAANRTLTLGVLAKEYILGTIAEYRTAPVEAGREIRDPRHIPSNA
jgi:hypothetical protein